MDSSRDCRGGGTRGSGWNFYLVNEAKAGVMRSLIILSSTSLVFERFLSAAAAADSGIFLPEWVFN